MACVAVTAGLRPCLLPAAKGAWHPTGGGQAGPRYKPLLLPFPPAPSFENRTWYSPGVWGTASSSLLALGLGFLTGRKMWEELKPELKPEPEFPTSLEALPFGKHNWKSAWQPQGWGPARAPGAPEMWL